MTQIKRVTETRDKKQAVVVLGFQGVNLKDSDRYALELLQGSVQRFRLAIVPAHPRKAWAGLLRWVAEFSWSIPGYFAFYVGTAPGQTRASGKELLKETQLLRTEGLSEEELQRAKAKIIGQKKIARQDSSAATPLPWPSMNFMGWATATFDQEDALYQSVTTAQIKSVAQKYLKPDAFVLSVVKPED